VLSGMSLLAISTRARIGFRANPERKLNATSWQLADSGFDSSSRITRGTKDRTFGFPLRHVLSVTLLARLAPLPS
jgi:hypothetical protein